MAEFRPRAWQRPSVGRLLVTIALEPPTASCNVQEHRRLADVTERLVRQLSGHSMPATWGVSDPASAAATATIVRAATTTGVPHEIALLGDASWMGAAAGRPRFAQELAQRLAAARARGIPVSTLLHPQSGPGEHLDLLVKQGVTAMCAIDVLRKRWPEYVLPKAVRYGVWDLRITGRLSAGAGWWAIHRLLRRIRRATGDDSMFHLLVEAATPDGAAQLADTSLARVLRQVAHLRDRGLVEVETMARTAARLSDVPAATPQRSILRVAA